MMSEVQRFKSIDTPIRLSDAAKAHLINYLEKEKQYKGVRLSVKKSGCSGMSYVIDYVSVFKDNDIIEPINASYDLYIDKSSFPFLKGTEIDYVTEGFNSKFQFKNPNQKGLCGCGESFTVED